MCPYCHAILPGSCIVDWLGEDGLESGYRKSLKGTGSQRELAFLIVEGLLMGMIGWVADVWGFF